MKWIAESLSSYLVEIGSEGFLTLSPTFLITMENVYVGFRLITNKIFTQGELDGTLNFSNHTVLWFFPS